MARKKKPVNNSGIPQHAIEAIARCILPDIIAYYETEKGQREFREWKAKRDAEQTFLYYFNFSTKIVTVKPTLIQRNDKLYQGT